MDIKTYTQLNILHIHTQLNIHTRHILHSYKAYVDGYKNLHRHILHSYKAHVDGYKNLHTTKYTHKTYLAFI